MVIGTGDIASVLPERDDLLFFASGVSNSAETSHKEFDREISLLVRQNRNKRLVYFSSLAVFYSNTPYADHKRAMEAAIKKYSPRHCIVRLGNITWGKNPHTLINYLRHQSDTGQELDVRDEYRYIVDKGEFLHWINLIPDFNCEMNITGRRMKVKQVVNEYVLGTRNYLAKSFTGVGAEIGVEQGEFSSIIAQYADKLYCVDAWQAHDGYRDHTRQDKLDNFLEATKQRMAPYNHQIVRKFSMDAVKDFTDESLDFVYIDANHDYEHVLEDVTEWTKKVRPGGIVAGHDYIRRKGQDKYYNVPKAVDEYVKAHGKALRIHRGDQVPSWSFIK